jgi:hypothetical protein
LIVSDECRAAWGALDEVVCDQVAVFLSAGAPEASGLSRSSYVIAHGPSRIAADLASGGAILRQAFPRLSRTLVNVMQTSGERVVLEVVSEGAHEEPFFDILSATSRAVRFVERHEVVLLAGGVLEDRVTLDLRSILRQLFGPLSAAVGDDRGGSKACGSGGS